MGTLPGSHRTLGDSGLAVGRLGLGGAPLGNLYTAVGDTVARATIDEAWDCGIRLFDTAPHYGLGLSERRLGAALRDRPREQLVLSTKVGRLLEPLEGRAGECDDGFKVARTHQRRLDYSAAGVQQSLEASLERLGTDRSTCSSSTTPTSTPTGPSTRRCQPSYGCGTLAR